MSDYNFTESVNIVGDYARTCIAVYVTRSVFKLSYCHHVIYDVIFSRNMRAKNKQTGNNNLVF